MSSFDPLRPIRQTFARIQRLGRLAPLSSATPARLVRFRRDLRDLTASSLDHASRALRTMLSHALTTGADQLTRMLPLLEGHALVQDFVLSIEKRMRHDAAWLAAPVAGPHTRAEAADATLLLPPLARGTIRRLTLADKPLFRDHLLRLDTDTRRSRFAMHATDHFLEGYSETAFALETVIFAFFEDGLIRGTGELRAFPETEGAPGGRQAEAAFCVEPGFRHLGIGTRLMELTLLEAEATGVRHMYINCLASNRKMQALARKFGANLTFNHGDVIGLLNPRDATAKVALAEAPHLWRDVAARS